MPFPPKSTRRFLIPEVVQTSALDCGPAALKCLLEGFGVSVSYGRLREACQTDVDGTSIDTLEALAGQLDLNAEQIMLPLDHLLLAAANALPAIVVVRQPNGFTHFVVAWRKHGDRWIQIMDPATGRRWPTIQQFLDTVYVHTFPVPAVDWRDWAGSHAFLAPLRFRIEQIGGDADPLVAAALENTSWLGLATLDAAVRLVTALVRGGGVRRGRAAHTLIQSLISRTQVQTATVTGPIPAAYWSVLPATQTDISDSLHLTMRGAVLVRVQGVRAADARERPSSPELNAARAETAVPPERTLRRLLATDGWLKPILLLPAILLAALGVVLEAMIFRSLIGLGQVLAPAQRSGALSAVLFFLVGLLLLQMRITTHTLRLGRLLDMHFRRAFLEKLPRLKDQYFRSRPSSDMAQRSHAAHKMRDLPTLAAALLRDLFTLILTTAGIIWLSPHTAVPAILAAVGAIGFPLAVLPYLAEKDLRVQTHVGSLSQFFLDALLGLSPIRAHRAQAAVRHEHETRLVEWGRASLAYFKAAVLAKGGQTLLGYASVAAIIIVHLARGGSVGTILLLTYWALSLPEIGEEIGLMLRRYPSYRNVVLRLMEPLTAPEEPAERTAAQATVTTSGGTKIEMQNIYVLAAGSPILQAIDLTIEPGQHVAIVGPSGAGKSSLVGLLLGWHRAAHGHLLVDDQPMNARRLAELRQRTAWVDPTVQLWNQSLLKNLYYGSDTIPAMSLPQVLHQADLLSVLKPLPDGLQTALGESGGRLSGGEGQRVRLGRAMLRPNINLVILDEPFRGLVRQQRQELLRQARRLWQRATLLCITHDVSETLEFDRVLVLEKGRLVEAGIPSELAVKSGSRYAEMLLAERSVRRAFRGNEAWRRLWLENGRLVETTVSGAQL